MSKSFSSIQRPTGLSEVLKSVFRPERKTVVALDDVSFTIRRGEFVAYAGANGAGKSTTIKMVSGMLLPTTGTLRTMGADPHRQRIDLMRHVGILMGNRSELWFDLPVKSSFEWKKRVWEIPDATYKRVLDEVTELLDLAPLLPVIARELSLGQRMRADIAMMLLHAPDLILLDEPTLGLDVLAKRQLISFLKQLHRERKTTVVVTSHDMDDLEEMAQRILLLANGKLAFEGDFAALRGFLGCSRRLKIRTDPSANAPEVPGAIHMESALGWHTYAFDADELPMQRLLQELARQSGVQDVQLTQAPLEQALADRFRDWKEKA